MRYISNLFLILALVLAALPARAGTAVPQLSARSAVLLDAADGRILYQKNGGARAYPASLTKMLTCILALERGDANSTVYVSGRAVNLPSTRLHGGERVRQCELLYQMMLVSDNGAAAALAEHISGSVPAFAALMNAKAEEIGCTGTHFANPHGLTDVNHYSTARDLAYIARYCLTNPAFSAIVGTKMQYVNYERPHRQQFCENTNDLLYSYAGAVGVKTGYTRAAGECLAAAAERDGRTLIAVVLHAKDEDSRFSEAAALLDYGFAAAKKPPLTAGAALRGYGAKWTGTSITGDDLKLQLAAGEDICDGFVFVESK